MAVTPCRVGPRLLFNPSLPAQLRNQMNRNVIAKLPENRELRSGWFVMFNFFTPAVWQAKRLQASLFSSSTWDACENKKKERFLNVLKNRSVYSALCRA